MYVAIFSDRERTGIGACRVPWPSPSLLKKVSVADSVLRTDFLIAAQFLIERPYVVLRKN